MKTFNKALQSVAFTAILATTAFCGSANASSENAVKLLTANFEPREVVQVEVGDFHFVPGQVAPIHTHAAPAVGYVAKGSIINQVEGEKPQVLRTGDAFFEPVNKRILRFDNASATEEAIFLDFNLQQVGEPFIIFEKAPTEAIDRRTLPTIDLDDKIVDQVSVYAADLIAGGEISLETSEPTLGVVAEGIVEIRVEGQKTLRVIAGNSFSIPSSTDKATIVNTSSEVPAKVITFLVN